MYFFASAFCITPRCLVGTCFGGYRRTSIAALSRARQAYKDLIPPLSPEQGDILTGMLLGDAYARWDQHIQHARIKFAQSFAQRGLIDHLFEVFQDYVWVDRPFTREPTPAERACGVRSAASFTTFTHPVFDAYHHAFYTRTPRSSWVKRILPDMAARLTPRVLAYQLMCDGAQRP